MKRAWLTLGGTILLAQAPPQIFDSVHFLDSLQGNKPLLSWFKVTALKQKVSLHADFFFMRKPRPVSQLVAQQVTQQFVPPTQSKKEKKDKVEKEKSEKETTSKKNSHKKTRPRLKNVDRSSAQHLEVTVGDLTVIITDFKEKTKSPPASSAASADQHSQSGSSSDNTERGMSRSSSPRGEASSLNGESH
ncbi:YY1-associated factor 2 isoform X2 [Tursiops truncatus]|uniref:YY1-associated factor 2 isoform X2 n=1 Tax=Tursiops truncatus TaxID=9739 RepID=UPI003CCF1548